MFAIHFALWICRAHLAWSIGTFGTALVALCTSLAWGTVIWTMYLTLEPIVWRHWPRTIISWTSVLTGRVRDPIVGRDVLFGAAFGMALRLMDRFFDLPIWGSTPPPGLGASALLLGARSTLGVAPERFKLLAIGETTRLPSRSAGDQSSGRNGAFDETIYLRP